MSFIIGEICWGERKHGEGMSKRKKPRQRCCGKQEISVFRNYLETVACQVSHNLK